MPELDWIDQIPDNGKGFREELGGCLGSKSGCAMAIFYAVVFGLVALGIFGDRCSDKKEAAPEKTPNAKVSQMYKKHMTKVNAMQTAHLFGRMHG